MPGMELTAKAIEEAEFRQTFRGYDVDQVDDFLEQVAAGVDALTKQLAAVSTGEPSAAPAPKADAAPVAGDAPAEAAPPVQPTAGPKSIEDNTDELRRTLILAQRTADAAIREAKEEAARLVAEARNSSNQQIAEADAQAKKLVADAEAKAAAIVAEAERQALEHSTTSHNRLRAEIEALEGTREQLRSDANVLDRHVEEQRQQLRGTLTELQRLIDDPHSFRLVPPPPVSDVAAPQFEVPEPIGPAPSAASVGAQTDDETAETGTPATSVPEPPAAESAPAPEAAPAAPGGEEAATPPAAEGSPAREISMSEPPPPAPVPDSWTSLRDEPVVDPAAPGAAEPGAAEPEPAAAGDAAPTAEAEPSPSEPAAAANGEKPAEQSSAPPTDEGEPTQSVPTLVGDADEDAFLAELRKAMTDDEPLGPRDKDIVTRPTVDPMGEDVPRQRPRFGRRR